MRKSGRQVRVIKTFASELVHANRRKGIRHNLWGAIYDAPGRWFACIPTGRGNWQREQIGIFGTQEAASAAAVAAWKLRKTAVPHIDGCGNLCFCARALKSTPEERKQFRRENENAIDPKSQEWPDTFVEALEGIA
jgi:hypothetical protein